MRLDSNTVLITGGASGIGFALARRFAAAGSTVAVCGRRQEQLDQARHDCPELHTIQCDVSVESERIRLIEQVVHDYPAFNVLINNAGLQQRPPPLVEAQDWNQHRVELDTNLAAPMHLSFLAIAPLRQQPTAAIVNVTSGLAFTPIAMMPTYCATKAAMHSFSLSLRLQLAATSIRVFEAVPPAVNTDLGGKGLHTFGVPLEPYADDVMDKLARDVPEFGYQFSDAARLGSRAESDERFATMNANFGRR
ncbi:MAG TPA: SDR family NAD(P)-dependent oxidoreductase [Polyangiales bacterium]|nr:SDR family NAD(P)-dependent oxidoreductase [Polyangiales bacterium]